MLFPQNGRTSRRCGETIDASRKTTRGIFERQHGDHMAYPLVMTNIAIENHLFLMGKLIISMAMFNSYVKLPEGIVKDARNDMVYMVY